MGYPSECLESRFEEDKNTRHLLEAQTCVQSVHKSIFIKLFKLTKQRMESVNTTPSNTFFLLIKTHITVRKPCSSNSIVPQICATDSEQARALAESITLPSESPANVIISKSCDFEPKQPKTEEEEHKPTHVKSKRVDHIHKHTRIESEKLLKCEKCDYSTLKPYSLKYHGKVHTEEKLYECDYCSYKSRHKSDLNLHRRTHTGEKPYLCNLCDYKCTNASNLKKHLLSHHTDEKPYQCDKCEFRSAYQSSLNTHLRMKHNPIVNKPCLKYKCDLCDYKSAWSKDLKLHMAMHAGKRLYKCDMCDFRALTTYSLKCHVKMHTGENVHKCEFCKYKTVYRADLITHIRKHTGEKPYQCPMCEQRCSTLANLKYHLKTRHSEENIHDVISPSRSSKQLVSD